METLSAMSAIIECNLLSNLWYLSTVGKTEPCPSSGKTYATL